MKQKNIVNNMSGAETLANVAELFKTLSNPSRLMIVNALLISEMSVNNLAAAVGRSQPPVSQHLAVLRAAKLVRLRREGKRILYALDDEHVREIFLLGVLHASHTGGEYGAK